MKRKVPKRLLIAIFLSGFSSILLAVLINVFTNDKFWTEESIIPLLILLGIFISGLLWGVSEVYKYKFSEQEDSDDEEIIFDDEREKNISKMCRKLKERYNKRYLSKLNKRYEITLEVSKDWESKDIEEFVGEYEGRGEIGQAFESIKNKFDQKGRLLIVGEPGVGKTVLLLRFALDLFKRLNLKEKSEFPMIFNLAGWSDKYEDFDDWLVSVLVSREGLSKTFAIELLKEERIILLLDGLDELAGNEAEEKEPGIQKNNSDELARSEAEEKKCEIQTKCLESLAKYLEGGKKAVICCRGAEFLKISEKNGKEILSVPKVKVLNLSRAEVVISLEKASVGTQIGNQRPAEKILDIIINEDSRQSLKTYLTEIDPDAELKRKKITEAFVRSSVNKKCEKFLEVLQIPFYFTTALEVFDEDEPDVEAMLEHKAGIENFLIQKFVEKKIKKKPPKPIKFKNLFKNQKWLTWFAKYLTNKNKPTFELADLQPDDLRWSGIFKLFYGLIVYLFTFFPVTLIFCIVAIASIIDQLKSDFPKMLATAPELAILLVVAFSFLVCVAIVILTGLPFCIVFGFRTKIIKTEESNRFSIRPLLDKTTWKKIIFAGLPYAGVAILIFGWLILVSQKTPLIDRILSIISMFFSIYFFIVLERISNYSRKIENYKSLKHNYQRLRRGFLYNIIRLNLITVIFVCLFNLFFERTNFDDYNFRIILLFVPFILIISILNTALLKHFILRSCLIISNKIPIRFAKFLDYAAAASILEKDGGQWRFRHQYLQDYFLNLK